MSGPIQEPITLFSYEKFRFTLEVTSLMILPPYKGAVFRGAFGNVFRRVVCAVPRGDCATCLLRGQCLYVSFFEPPPPRDYADAAKFSKAPPPFVLNPPLTTKPVFRPNELLDFELVLIGPAIEALPYYIYTFTELGRMGLGKERGKYRLLAVDLIRGEEPVRIYDGRTQMISAYPPDVRTVHHAKDDPGSAITLHFLTPVRLKVKGDLVTELTFPVLFERLAQRLKLLSAFYNPAAMPPDFSHLIALSQSIAVTSDKLNWYDWERYSGRQKTTMKFGGLKGSVSFSGELGPFMPYLRLGEQVNIGQGTTFGLGRISLNSHKTKGIHDF